MFESGAGPLSEILHGEMSRRAIQKSTHVIPAYGAEHFYVDDVGRDNFGVGGQPPLYLIRQWAA
jgi:hypothetical protein